MSSVNESAPDPRKSPTVLEADIVDGQALVTLERGEVSIVASLPEWISEEEIAEVLEDAPGSIELVLDLMGGDRDVR